MDLLSHSYRLAPEKSAYLNLQLPHTIPLEGCFGHLKDRLIIWRQRENLNGISVAKGFVYDLSFTPGYEAGSYKIEIVFPTTKGPAVITTSISGDPMHGARDHYNTWERFALTKKNNQTTILFDEQSSRAVVFGQLCPNLAVYLNDLVEWYQTYSERRIKNRIMDFLYNLKEKQPEYNETYDLIRTAAKNREPILPILEPLIPTLGGDIAKLVPAVDLLELTPAAFITGWTPPPPAG